MQLISNAWVLRFAQDDSAAASLARLRFFRFEIRDFRFFGCGSSRQARVRKVNSGTKTCSAGAGDAYQIGVTLVFAGPSGKFRAGTHLEAAEDFDFIGDLRFLISDFADVGHLGRQGSGR